jgi:hypothetical protein
MDMWGFGLLKYPTKAFWDNSFSPSRIQFIGRDKWSYIVDEKKKFISFYCFTRNPNVPPLVCFWNT